MRRRTLTPLCLVGRGGGTEKIAVSMATDIFRFHVYIFSQLYLYEKKIENVWTKIFNVEPSHKIDVIGDEMCTQRAHQFKSRLNNGRERRTMPGHKYNIKDIIV